jgi:hypothetical protein
MDIQKVNHYKSIFDSIAHEIKDDEGILMEVSKMIPTAKGAQRPIQNFMLTRYAIL